MDRAVIVCMPQENYNYFKAYGYFTALKQLGWAAEYRSYAEAANADICSYDLILWDGAIPEPILHKISPAQICIGMGGAGSSIDYYRRFTDRIRLLTTSFWFLDSPGVGCIRPDLTPWTFWPHRLM